MHRLPLLPIAVMFVSVAVPARAATSVPLTVEEPSGVQRTAWPVTSGVPLAQGALADDKTAALFDVQGKEMPLQTEVLARWPDGSVRWLLIDTQVDLAAKEKKVLVLRCGLEVKRAAVENPIRVTKQADGSVVLEPGPVRLEYGSKQEAPYFFPQGQATLVDTTAGGKPGRRLTYNCGADGVTLWAGQNGYFKPQIEEMVVEQAGPVRACLRVSGSHVDKEKMFRYVARVHAWRGQPYVRVFYTLVNDRQDTLMAGFEGLGVFLTTPAHGKPWSLLDGKLVDKGRLFQVDESHCLLDDKPAGCRACGWAAVGSDEGGLAVGLREFWQNWPKAIGVGSGLGAVSVDVDLCPKLPAGLYDGKPLKEESKLYYYLRGRQYTLKIGAAKTHEFWIKYLSAKPDPQKLGDFFRAVEDPLLATCEPAYACGTKAAGEFPPADPKKYAGYDDAVDRALDDHLKRRGQDREYGMLNYGDWYGERGVNWGNLEYDLAHGLFIQYLRTGDRRFFLRAEQAARHHIDVDVVHAVNPLLKNPWGAPPRVGDIWLHCVGHTGGYYENAPLPVDRTYQMGHSTNFGHIWVSGDLDYYRLTGDRRARDVAVEMADAMASHMPTQYGDHIRAMGWPMILVLDAYQATGDKKYLDAATANWQVLKKNIDWQKGWMVRLAKGHCLHDDRRCWGNVPFMEGMTLCALARYHRITGDPEVLRAISVGIDQMIRECWQEDTGTFRYTACPLSSRTPYVALSAEAMAYEAKLSGNKEHLRILRKGLETAIRQGGGFGKGLAQLLFFTPHGLAALEE